MFLGFETLAIVLWLTQGNIFFLFNFSYIGCCLAIGGLLMAKKVKRGRNFVMFAVGLYMLVFAGLIMGENMQITGFWYYLFAGVFGGAVIHYLVAKIFDPFIFGRGWCGYACRTAMALDCLPHKGAAPVKSCDLHRLLLEIFGNGTKNQNRRVYENLRNSLTCGFKNRRMLYYSAFLQIGYIAANF